MRDDREDRIIRAVAYAIGQSSPAYLAPEHLAIMARAAVDAYREWAPVIPAGELDRPPLAGRTEQTRSVVRRHGIAKFTPEHRTDPRLRELEAAYADSDEHVRLPHKLDGDDPDGERTTTYLRRTTLDDRIGHHLRMKALAEIMPDVDVDLFERHGGFGA